MNGFEALELMRKGKTVTKQSIGGKWFLEDGIIKIECDNGFKTYPSFNFNDEYELYEKTYTGLEAIELMKQGYTVSSAYGNEIVEYTYVFKLHNENICALYPSGNTIVEQSFDFSVRYKIYND